MTSYRFSLYRVYLAVHLKTERFMWLFLIDLLLSIIICVLFNFLFGFIIFFVNYASLSIVGLLR